MKPVSTRWLLALALSGTLALVWYVSSNESGDSAPTKPTNATRKTPVTRAKERLAASKPSLLGQGQLLSNIERPSQGDDIPDLFRSYSWYVAPPPPPPLPAPPPPKPTAPPLPFAFIGQYTEGNSKLIMLSRGDRLLTVSIGDVIDNTYKVESMNAGQLTFVYLPLATSQALSTGVIQ